MVELITFEGYKEDAMRRVESHIFNSLLLFDATSR
jgi:hypothetical protein